MTRARWGALLIVAGALAALAALALSHSPERKARPKLLLLTSLPLVFGEDFSVENNGSPTLTALQHQYDVIPISATSPSDLGKGSLLLLAHPLPQTAENLVALDRWVRGGGRLVLLADPMLEWPSGRPLGDPLRAPALFMDTGLLKHWGLRLDAPAKRGPQMRQVGSREVVTVSPGALFGACPISDDRLIARCRIGSGRATVLADADFLNSGEGEQGSNDALLEELARLSGS